MDGDVTGSYWLRARRISRRRLAQVGTIGGAGFWLAACGGKGNQAAKGGSTGASGSPQSGGAAQARKGGTFILQTTDNKRGFDPMGAQAWAAGDNYILLPVYSNLMQFHTGPGADANKHEVVGDLITKWEQVDPSTVSLKITPGASFHNTAPVNGRKVTSADIKYSVERIKASQFAYKNAYLNFDSVQTPDDGTAVIKLAKPDADIIDNLAHHYLKVIPQEAGVQKQGAPLGRDFATPVSIIGSGPWVFKEYVPDDHITYQRNPNYFKSGLPYPETLLTHLVPMDPAAQQAAVLAKKAFTIDGTQAPTIASSEDPIEDYVKAGMQRFDYEDVPLHQDQVTMNTTKPPLNDIRVRRALVMAFDTGKVESGILKYDNSRKAMNTVVGVLVPAHGDYYWPLEKYKPDVAQWYKFDVQKANQMLDAAGYPKGSNGVRFEVQLSYSHNYNDAEMEALAGYLKEQVGVSFKLNPMVHAVALTTLHAGHFEGVGSVGEKQGPSVNLEYSIYTKTNTFDPLSGTVEDPKLIQMYESQFGDTDHQSRVNKVHAMQEYIADQAWTFERFIFKPSLVWWPDKAGGIYAKDRHQENFWVA